ncbi:hypothetical protein [Breoghania corrubedonensis]|nr:hypothetical protein [Breoghania corrubedonensis]
MAEADELAKRGIYVPAATGIRHRHLQLFDAHSQAPGLTRIFDGVERHERLPLATRWVEEVAEAAQNFGTVIMTEETLVRLLPEEVETMACHLKAAFDPVDVFVCFRPHEDLVRSNYRQLITATYRDIKFKRYAAQWMGSDLSRYCDVLDTYLRAFGETRVHGYFYRFSKGSSSNTDILGAMGAGSAAEIATSTVDNRSRPAEVVELKRRLNPQIEGMIQELGGHDVPRFHSILSDALSELAALADFNPVDETELQGALPRRAARRCSLDWEQLCSQRYAHVFARAAAVAAE